MVRLRQLERGGITDALGVAVFERLTPRSLTVTIEHIGFVPAEQTVQVREGERTVVEFSLQPTALHLAGIVVTGTGRARGAGEVYQPTSSLTGRELERSLDSSIPGTLQGVPGFHMQYNGPGAASPSIRGMSGDRVLVLEDGNRTGDLYASASDHGVMVEPLTAQRIEVVRGPAGLLYGSNALGGVVNVIRDDVPRSLPSGVTGTVSSQVESVSRGGGLGAVVLAPAGPFALRAEASGRSMDDARTPLGALERTDLTSWNGSVGASWIPAWGFVGGALRIYDNTYGVPGEFNGQLIPGGHPGGVDIDTRRTTARVRAGILTLRGFFDSVELDGAANRYIHDEIEGQLDGRRILGARFDQVTLEGNLIARHDHTIHEHPDGALRAEGAYGLAVKRRDLTAGGVSPGSRSGEDLATSVFGYEEFQRGPHRLQVGLRYDRHQVTPRRTDPIRVRTQQREIVKEVSPRDFVGMSGSLAGLWEFREGWVAGVSAARSFRAPSMEELYSDGPHLADFSFDIGSPGLEPERGLGLDLFLRGTRPDLSVEVAAFWNRVDGFIYYAQTGETVRIFRDGVAPRVTPVYESRGDDALFAGAEGRVQWEVASGLVLDLTASYTRATRRSDDDPLPFIPPLSGRFEARWETGPWFVSGGFDGSLAQDRIPLPVRIGDIVERPQEPTDGYGLLNAGAGWRQTRGGFTHSVTLQARNLSNREWRDHLSRIKDIAPQPGRNVQLTYRVYF